MSAPEPYAAACDAAFALLMAFRNGETTFTRKAASFVGETLVDGTPLTEKQEVWLQSLLAKAGLPPLVVRGAA